jgi:hypothetical protein
MIISELEQKFNKTACFYISMNKLNFNQKYELKKVWSGSPGKAPNLFHSFQDRKLDIFTCHVIHASFGDALYLYPQFLSASILKPLVN